MLYLHETIDIIGDGQQAYLDSVGERASHSERQGLSRLMGTWKVIGSTARWPRVVNLWEMDSWSHWAEALERQFIPEKRDPHLGPWWSKATQWRSGGFDRILEPAAYSPTRDELRALGLRAWVCVQSIVRLTPGQRRPYLDAVGGELRPLLEARGLTLMGAYVVPMRSEEAIVIWAAPDFRFLCDLYARRANDAELQKWGAWASGVRQAFEATWLVPSADCFFYPSKS